MYNKIKNPNTHQELDINSSAGQSVVNLYLHQAKGGNIDDEDVNIQLHKGDIIELLVLFNQDAENNLKENILECDDPHETIELKKEFKRLQKNKVNIGDTTYIWMEASVNNLDENNEFSFVTDTGDIATLDQVNALQMRYNRNIIWQRSKIN